MTHGKIRLATSDDAVHLSRVHCLAREVAMPWLPILHTPEQVVSYFAGRVLSSETVFVCDVDDRTIGFTAFSGGWVNHLYVEPAHWGRGHGARLLDLAKAASPTLQLWTFQGNRLARRFYARQGFSEAELTDGQHNEEKTPDVRLVWQR